MGLEANQDADAVRAGWDPTQPYPEVPPLTSNAMKTTLEYTAVPMQDDRRYDYDWLMQGAGRVNPLGAIALASDVPPSSVAPRFGVRLPPVVIRSRSNTDRCVNQIWPAHGSRPTTRN